MPAPLHLPVPGRHALDGGCPSWCDPRRCVRGQIHIGTPTYWPSTVGDLEFGLARYQADGQSEAFLLTLRALATVGTLELVVSEDDLGRFIDVAERLRNTSPVGGESTPGGTAR